MEVNEHQKLTLMRKLKNAYNGDLMGKKAAIWGLAFKPNTDDIREAPALYIIDELLRQDVDISVFDPEAIDNIREIYGDKINYAQDQYEALESADFLLIVTEWGAFRNPDFKKIKNNLRYPVVFDGRNIYSVHQMEDLGFYYNSIGRRSVGVLKAAIHG